MKKCFIFHKWTKWEYYEKYSTGFGIEALFGYLKTVSIIIYMKKRHCKKCGKTQEVEINSERA